jgi:hypothetical protein
MIPRPCFQSLHTVYFLFCYMFAHSDTYSISQLLLIIITTTCISLSLHRTSAPIHLTSVLGVLRVQETFCIVIAGLLERDSFDLFLPEFDKPWVIHLRETCCCSTNLCTWRPNTVYKNKSMCRHQAPHSTRTHMVNDDSFWISDPVEIAEVDRFGSDPEFPLHFIVQRWSHPRFYAALRGAT